MIRRKPTGQQALRLVGVHPECNGYSTHQWSVAAPAALRVVGVIIDASRMSPAGPGDMLSRCELSHLFLPGFLAR